MMIDEVNIPPYQKAHVVVYGDLMLDRYWYGPAMRISPEAPVPVVNINYTEARPGGAANVALNMATLGTSVELMGLVGEDDEAAELESLLSLDSIRCYFHRIPNYPTIIKLRVLSQNQQLLRMDFEKRLDSSCKDEELVYRYQESLLHANAVVLSDYAKGALINASILIKKAREKALPILVDPKSPDFISYKGATLLTPNLREFEAVVGPCKTEGELESKARVLIQNHHFEAILVTRGKLGMILIQKDRPSINLVSHAREVYDVTGAGDAVISVMAASLAAGSSLISAAKLANLAASLVVRKPGVATVTVPELRQALHQMISSHAKIVSEKQLLQSVADARACKASIVMTNGCFDILHAGHVYYLEAAKFMGDRLIVAVNDDQSIARLKGAGRPLNSLQARMEVLAALRSVDWVIPFWEDTPARLISLISPDILVKGGDYQPHQISGGDAVLKNGGKVLTIPLKSGFSISQLIKKIRGVTM